MNIDKDKLRSIARALNVEWVDYDHETERYSFQKKQYRSLKIVGRDGETKRKAGILSDTWMEHSEIVYSVTECYEDQLENGDLPFMIKHGLTQSGPRPS